MERLNFGISAGAVAASWALASPAFAASLAFGAALEAANFRVLRAASVQLLAGNLEVGQIWVAAFAVRFVVFAAGLGLALRYGADPVGLTIGVSTIIPAVVVGAWWQRPPIGIPEPGPPSDDPSWETWNPWLARERDPAESEES